MAKFNPAEELENYVSEPTYFSLKDNRDKELVRFMLNSIEDVDGYAVHRVKVNGYDRNVSCLRSYSDPLDKCPLCEAGFKVIPKFFIPLYIERTGTPVIWERGKNFYPQLQDLCAKCNPTVSHLVEIERNGAKGDTNTVYEMYPDVSDGTLLEDLPEAPDPVGTSVLEKTFDELTTYVQTGSFETGDANPINRTSASNDGVESRRRRDVSAGGTNGVARRRGTGTAL